MVDSQRRQVLKAVGGAGALLAVGGVGTAGARMGKRMGASGEDSIVDVAVGVNSETGEFSTLIAALQAAGLVGALDGRRQLTAFAPTDAAFQAIGLDATTVGDLPTDALTDILLYHVTPGRRYAASLNDGEEVEMLNGDTTLVDVMSGDIYLNDSKVVGPNIEASNGVVHVVDAVLLP
jgi:uncharacterized surface protein with fasciclin (FAS1) repeats